MITIPAIVKCDAYLATEQAEQCEITAAAEFEYLGCEGNIPKLLLNSLPEGWSTWTQPDGCQDRHFCPKHFKGDET